MYRTSRILLALAALLMAVGGVMHALAFFAKIEPQIAAAKLSPFLEGAFNGLWLIDSSTMLCLTLIFGWLAVRPFVATRVVIVMLGLIPLGTGMPLYTYLGNFFAAHIMMATTASVWMAAV